MNDIALYDKMSSGSTLVSNGFIDTYMKDANEVQIKIYLELLRLMGGHRGASVSYIADFFNYTEREVLRALKYWNSTGLITLIFDSDKSVCGISLNDPDGVSPRQMDLGEFEDFKGTESAPSLVSSPEGAAPSSSGAKSEPEQTSSPDSQSQGATIVELQAQSRLKPSYTNESLQNFQDRQDVREIVFMTQKYMGHPLSYVDITTLMYMYDALGFPIDLIEFLIEYCVSAGHRSMHYIEKTALAWADEGISSVQDAREATSVFKKDYYKVLRAFGISGRNPVKSDIDYIRHWQKDYGYEMDIILEAVNRTMRQIAKPSFSYADSILKNWQKRGVHHLTDIDRLDGERRRSTLPPVPVNDKFRNFEERTYDYDALERKFAKNGKEVEKRG